MAFTGRLGTALSRPGNLEPGAVEPFPARFTQVGAEAATVSTPEARFTQVGADLAWQLPIAARFTQVGMEVAYVMPAAGFGGQFWPRGIYS